MTDHEKKETAAKAVHAAPHPAGAVMRRRKLVPILVVAGLMGVEGIGVFILTKLMTGGVPSAAEGAYGVENGEYPGATRGSSQSGGEHGDKGDRFSNGPVEVELTESRVNNQASGKLVTIKMRVSALVTGANAERFKPIVDANRARINDRLNVVIRSATPQELNEPGLETIKRQLKHEFSRVLGDENLIIEILVPEMIQSGPGL